MRTDEWMDKIECSVLNERNSSVRMTAHHTVIGLSSQY